MSSPYINRTALPRRASARTIRPMPKRRNGKIIVCAASVKLVALMAAIGAARSTLAFCACFGSLLMLFGSIQLFVAAKLFLNRHNSLFELSQPLGLSLFAISGSIATVASFLFALPQSNVACALRQPIILTNLTLMGSVLVARSWRIGCIVCPACTFASSSTSISQNDVIQLF